MLRYIRYIMSNTAPALEENWWQVLYHSFIKKYISDQTNLQQLWRSVFSRSFWQNWQIKYLHIIWATDKCGYRWHLILTKLSVFLQRTADADKNKMKIARLCAVCAQPCATYTRLCAARAQHCATCAQLCATCARLCATCAQPCASITLLVINF